MASGTKKRRKSQSPARGATSKRARVASSGTSNRTQHHEYDSHSSRAGSVKDTYLSQKQGRSISLPTGDDWVFRVKVISSATDLGDDLFKNAVQGLVKICFPEGILDQLGPQVLEQHMREEKAPEKNIERMSEIFRAEMEQRMVSMIAEHLDTAAKVDSVLKTLLSASARAHGDNLGDDMLGYVTASLLKLKAKASECSTEWLAGGDAAATEEEEEGSSAGGSSTSDISDKEPTPPPKTKKPKKRDRKSQRARSKTPDDILEDVEVDNNVPATLPKQHTSKNKDRKISSTWKWHVDAAELANEDVAEAFPRTSDLFAYHALPISQRKLGPSASKKEIRCEMQSLLDGTPQEEFEKWVESLQKLLDGDRDMLERQESYSSNNQQRLSRITPAPVDIHKTKAKKPAASVADQTQSNSRANHDITPSVDDVAIKHEGANSSRPNAHDKKVAISSHLMGTTASLRQLSIEQREFRPPIADRELTIERKNGDPQKEQTSFVSGFRMPILNLLYGTDNLTTENCLNDAMEITRIIMTNLGDRVKVERIGVKGVDGATSTCTKAELQSAILSSFPSKATRVVSFLPIKHQIEASLIPWVMAEPRAFPELKSMPFIFSQTMPVQKSKSLAVITLFGSWKTVFSSTAVELWTMLVQALKQRGVSEASLSAADIDFLQVDRIMNDERKPTIEKRVALERLLRRIVFDHRGNFSQLKNTVTVQTWELKTGLTCMAGVKPEVINYGDLGEKLPIGLEQWVLYVEQISKHRLGTS